MAFFPTSKTQIKDIQGVGVGNTAIINCPKGPRYRRLILTLGDSGLGNGNAPAVNTIVNELRVILGSKIVRRYTGAQLDILNKLNGAQYGSYGVGGGANGTGRTYLPIFFEEPWRKRADFQNGLSLETGWLDQNGVFQVQADILNTTTTPVIGALAVTDGFSSGKPNPIMKYYANDYNTASAELDVANIFQGAPPADLVDTLSWFNTSDGKSVTKLRLVLGSQTIVDDQTSDQMVVQLQGDDMTPLNATGAYHLVFDHDDLFQSLRPVSSISASQATLTLSAASAGTLRLIQQRLGDPTA